MADDITLSLQGSGDGFKPSYETNSAETKDQTSATKDHTAAIKAQTRVLEKMTLTNPNFAYGQAGFFSRSAGVEVNAVRDRDDRGRFLPRTATRPDVAGGDDPTAEDIWRGAPQAPVPTAGGRFRSPYTNDFLGSADAARMSQQHADWEYDQGGRHEPRSAVEDRERVRRETQALVQSLNLPEQRERVEEYDQISEGWANSSRRRRTRAFLTGRDSGAPPLDFDTLEQIGASPGYNTPPPPSGGGGSGGLFNRIGDWYNRLLLGGSPPRGGDGGNGSGGSGGGGGGNAGGGGGGNNVNGPNIVGPAVQLATGNAAAGRIGGSIAQSIGGVGGGAIGTAVGAVAAIAAYEYMPMLQAEYRKRDQFREAWIQTEVQGAAGRALRGEGLPIGTMAGQAGMDPRPGMSRNSPAYTPSERPYWDPFHAASYLTGQVESRLGYVNQPALTDAERRTLDEQSAQSMGISIEEFNKRREERRAKKGLKSKSGNIPRTPNPLDPESFNDQDNLWNRDPHQFDPEDMRMGLNVAPILSSLRKHGFATDGGSPNHKGVFPRDYAGHEKDIEKYHRPMTDAEKANPDALSRETKQYNNNRMPMVPHDPGHKLDQNTLKVLEIFEDWAFGDKAPDAPKGKPQADASSDPVFQLVQSPYVGMSA